MKRRILVLGIVALLVGGAWALIDLRNSLACREWHERVLFTKDEAGQYLKRARQRLEPFRPFGCPYYGKELFRP